MTGAAHLDGLIPEALHPRTRKIVIEDYVLDVEIGFHREEVGNPQRVLITVELWVEEEAFPSDDSIANALDYDFLHCEIRRLATGRRYNLQETLAREIYDLAAARKGVSALRVATRKPDIYADCRAVGVDIASF